MLFWKLVSLEAWLHFVKAKYCLRPYLMVEMLRVRIDKLRHQTLLITQALRSHSLYMTFYEFFLIIKLIKIQALIQLYPNAQALLRVKTFPD